MSQGTSVVRLIGNYAQNRYTDLMLRLGYGNNAKHDHYKDFGWPDEIGFPHMYRMYTRNGLAAAAVDKTIGRTWQDHPEVWEAEEPRESTLERLIRTKFDDLRVWQHFAEADRRSLVGRYSAIVIQFADDQNFDQPLGMMRGGLDAIVRLIPAWESQLTVSSYDLDQLSPTYGEPSMYEFKEAATGGNQSSPRSFKVHPDRVIIWSEDGTVFGRSALEAGYNDLIDAEKVKGAGGEGFWKTSRGAPVIEAPEGMKPGDVAKAMGIDQKDLVDEVSKQVETFMQGFDKALLLGGMTAKPLNIQLPEPEHFFLAPVQGFAASFKIPLKILMGSQTGERASTEDTREWNQVNMSRRTNRNIPLIKTFIKRLVQCGILKDKDWTIGWSDLTESTAEEKLSRSKDLSLINQQQVGVSQYSVFTDEEIREAAGYKPLALAEKVAYPKPDSQGDTPDEDKNPDDQNSSKRQPSGQQREDPQGKAQRP